MARIWEVFPKLFSAVRQSHEEVALVGHHDFVHAARVGEIAYRAALDEWGDLQTTEDAGAAGLCHNADRILQKKLGIGRREVQQEAVAQLVEGWLGHEKTFVSPFPPGCRDDVEIVARRARIVSAVIGHDGKNSPDDSRVLIALMEGDRVVNLDSDLFIRSGQYYHNLPAVDYRNFLDDPEATYQNPRSVLRDIAYSLDWVNPESPVCVRTRLGKQLAEERARVFRRFFTALKGQLAEEGIDPYPFAT